MKRCVKINQCLKSDKAPSIIYADLESLIKRINGCKNNFDKSFTTKVGENIACGYLMTTIWTFDAIGNKHDVYRDKRFCKKIY